MKMASLKVRKLSKCLADTAFLVPNGFCSPRSFVTATRPLQESQSRIHCNTSKSVSQHMQGTSYGSRNSILRCISTLGSQNNSVARTSMKQDMVTQSNRDRSMDKLINRNFQYRTMSTTRSRVIKCKAAVCRAAGEPVRLEEIEIHPPKASEIRLKMLYASLCHSDILCAEGHLFPCFPRAIGHEGVGVVESVGEGVTEFKEGDLVIPVFLGECKECENCKLRHTNMCTTHQMPMNGLMPDNTSRMTIGGQKLYHLFSCSTWSEYAVVSADYAVKIDNPNISLAHASFLSCGFTTGLGPPLKLCKAGESVVVMGLGAVGLGAIQGARMQKASKIIGVDRNTMKAEKGKAFGMTDFINPDKVDKPLSEAIRDVTGGSGADYCFECTGFQPLVSEALDAIKSGSGTLVQLGAGTKQTMELVFTTVLLGRTIKGYTYGGVKIKSELPGVVEKCANNEINLDELLTHEISLDQIEQAFDLLKKPDCVKVLIKI